MRPVQNRINTFPKQEQEVIDRFITAAPGLPLAECGAGIMAECLNMIIKPNRLALRKKMRFSRKSPFSWFSGRNQYIIGDFRYLFNKEYEIIIGMNNYDYLCVIRYVARYGFSPFEVTAYINSNNLKNLNLIDFFGDLSVLYDFSQLDGPSGKQTDLRSRVMDFAANRVRDLGMPVPARLQPRNSQSSASVQYAVGIEYVEKNADGIAIRSSGIARTITTASRIFDFQDFAFDTKDFITHVRIWMSDDIALAQGAELDEGAKAPEGNPDLMYMLFDIPVSDITDGQSHLYSIHYGDIMGKIIYDGTRVFSMYTPLQQPSFVSSISTTGTLDEINLVPMENACCFSGGRLWGISERKLIYSSLAGTIYQEQRDPLAIMDLGLGDIKSIAALNDDLYVFSERGVSLIRESDPGTPANPTRPQNISSASAIDINVFPIENFGIFALANGSIMFLDRSTREYAKTIRGFDINLHLGELAKGITDFKYCEGMLFFIAANRLFAFNIIDGCGISEFAMEDDNGGFVPNQLAYKDGTGLMIVYRQLNIETGEHEASIWIYRGIDEASPPDEQETRYSAMFAISSVYGFVEHWDTSVYANLNPNAVIGTQNLCDGVLHAKDSISMNRPKEDTDIPWEFRITSSMEGERRPIGKTVGVRVFIDRDPDIALPRRAAEEAIYQLKITAIKQTEVFRKSFNPNRGGEYLVTEDSNRIIEEEAWQE